MITKIVTLILSKIVDDPKFDAFAEKVADKVAVKVISALADDLKKNL